MPLHGKDNTSHSDTVTPNAAKIVRRQEALMRAVLVAGDFGLIVLGASHGMPPTATSEEVANPAPRQSSGRTSHGLQILLNEPRMRLGCHYTNGNRPYVPQGEPDAPVHRQ